MLKYFVVLLTLLGENIYAQTFENYTIDNSELPNNHINDVAIDKQNTKWLATDGDLASLNEAGDWTIYTHKDAWLEKISCIAIDKQNHKWIASYKDGISLIELNPAGEVIKRYELPNFENKEYYIRYIAIDKQDRKWLSTQEENIWVLDKNGKWYSYRIEHAIKEEEPAVITSIIVDKSGHIWIGTDKGLFSTVDGEEWIPYDVLDYVREISVDENSNVCANIIDRRGRKYLVCNRKDDIDLYNSAKYFSKIAKKERFDFKITLTDTKNRIWGLGDGLVQYEEQEKETIFALYNSLSTEFTSHEGSAMEMDTKGNLWIGTNDEGLYVLNLADSVAVEDSVIEEEVAEDSVLEEIVKEEVTEVVAEEVIVKTPTIFAEKLNVKTVKIGDFTKLEVRPNLKSIVAPKIEIQKVVIEQEGEKIEIEKGESIQLKNINFAPTKHTLTSTEGIEEILSFMRTNSNVKIELSGHTDRNPAKSHRNYAFISKQHFELSKRRVESVVKYLTARGIDAKRIVITPYGGTSPLVDFNSARNRRVEMKVLQIE